MDARVTALRSVSMGCIFKEASVDEVGVTGLSLILQTEEHVPGVDRSDALAGKLSGRSRTSSTRRRGT